MESPPALFPRPSPFFTGPGRPSRQKLHVRTCELAVLAGRVPPQVAQCDYEQAKRELTGETDPARQRALLDWIPACAGPNPVPAGCTDA